VYEYRAQVEDVVDGDTLDVDVDLGFRVTTRQRIRLLGCDTPEMHSPDAAKRAAAQDAKAFTRRWVEQNGGAVRVRSQKPGGGDKYGRWLATVYPPGATTDPSLNAALVEEGHAAAYDGGARG